MNESNDVQICEPQQYTEWRLPTCTNNSSHVQIIANGADDNDAAIAGDRVPVRSE